MSRVGTKAEPRPGETDFDFDQLERIEPEVPSELNARFATGRPLHLRNMIDAEIEAMSKIKDDTTSQFEKYEKLIHDYADKPIDTKPKVDEDFNAGVKDLMKEFGHERVDSRPWAKRLELEKTGKPEVEKGDRPYLDQIRLALKVVDVATKYERQPLPKDPELAQIFPDLSLEAIATQIEAVNYVVSQEAGKLSSTARDRLQFDLNGLTEAKEGQPIKRVVLGKDMLTPDQYVARLSYIYQTNGPEVMFRSPARLEPDFITDSEEINFTDFQTKELNKYYSWLSIQAALYRTAKITSWNIHALTMEKPPTTLIGQTSWATEAWARWKDAQDMMLGAKGTEHADLTALHARKQFVSSMEKYAANANMHLKA